MTYKESCDILEEHGRLREALRHLYVSACDTRHGYQDRDLHEPPAQTFRRAYEVLRDTEDGPDTVPLPPAL